MIRELAGLPLTLLVHVVHTLVRRSCSDSAECIIGTPIWVLRHVGSGAVATAWPATRAAAIAAGSMISLAAEWASSDALRITATLI
jgi:hypothetical protein